MTTSLLVVWFASLALELCSILGIGMGSVLVAVSPFPILSSASLSSPGTDSVVRFVEEPGDTINACSYPNPKATSQQSMQGSMKGSMINPFLWHPLAMVTEGIRSLCGSMVARPFSKGMEPFLSV